jgi:two-component system, chemotaxis family, protein-glutamate methylesterase/glutaminase
MLADRMASTRGRARTRKRKTTRRETASDRRPPSESPPIRRSGTARAAKRDLVVIGASGGGVEALSMVLGALPPKLPAAVALVLHRGDRGPNVLVNILGRLTKLPVLEVTDGMAVEPGRIYVPPLDHHVLVEGDTFQLSRGPKENHVRPAIDTLFRSAARSHGARVMGVILTGSLDDGTAGLLAIKRRGGLAIVQDPDEALFDGMPRSAVEHVAVDYKVPLAEVAALLSDLAGATVTFRPEVSSQANTAGQDEAGTFLSPGGGPVTAITCPDCGGALREIQDGDVLRFACHTGHRYSASSLVAGKDEDVESALWAGLRALNEKAELTRRMAERARARGDMGVSVRHLERIQDIENQIRVLRDLVQGN